MALAITHPFTTQGGQDDPAQRPHEELLEADGAERAVDLADGGVGQEAAAALHRVLQRRQHDDRRGQGGRPRPPPRRRLIRLRDGGLRVPQHLSGAVRILYYS